MKTVKFAAFLAILAATSAFAQSNPATGGTSTLAVNPAQSNTVTQSNASGQPAEQATPKTRAQVYAELVTAEKDGQLAYLNSTLYKGQ